MERFSNLLGRMTRERCEYLKVVQEQSKDSSNSSNQWASTNSLVPELVLFQTDCWLSKIDWQFIHQSWLFLIMSKTTWLVWERVQQCRGRQLRRLQLLQTCQARRGTSEKKLNASLKSLSDKLEHCTFSPALLRQLGCGDPGASCNRYRLALRQPRKNHRKWLASKLQAIQASPETT